MLPRRRPGGAAPRHGNGKRGAVRFSGPPPAELVAAPPAPPSADHHTRRIGAAMVEAHGSNLRRRGAAAAGGDLGRREWTGNALRRRRGGYARRRRRRYNGEVAGAEGVLAADLAGGGIYNEHDLGLSRRQRAGGPSSGAGQYRGDQPVVDRADGARMGELRRGSDGERRDGGARRPRRSAGGVLRMLRGAHVQHAGGAGDFAALVGMEGVPQILRRPGGSFHVPDFRAPGSVTSLGGHCSSFEGDEARPSARSRTPRHLRLLRRSWGFG